MNHPTMREIDKVFHDRMIIELAHAYLVHVSARVGLKAER